MILEPRKIKSDTLSTVSPSISHEVTATLSDTKSPHDWKRLSPCAWKRVGIWPVFIECNDESWMSHKSIHMKNQNAQQKLILRKLILRKISGMLCSYMHIINFTLNITRKLFCLLCPFLLSWKASNFQYASHTKIDCEIISREKDSVQSLLLDVPTSRHPWKQTQSPLTEQIYFTAHQLYRVRGI